jgi:hypothetical protein
VVTTTAERHPEDESKECQDRGDHAQPSDLLPVRAGPVQKFRLFCSIDLDGHGSLPSVRPAGPQIQRQPAAGPSPVVVAEIAVTISFR